MKDIKPVEYDAPLLDQQEGESPLSTMAVGAGTSELEPIRSITLEDMAPVSRRVKSRRAVTKIHPWCPRRFCSNPSTPQVEVKKSSSSVYPSPMQHEVEELSARHATSIGVSSDAILAGEYSANTETSGRCSRTQSAATDTY